MSSEDFLLVREAAEALGVSANTIRAWADSGKLTEYRHPINNYRLFKQKDVALLKKRIDNPPATGRKTRAK
ncbi:helix-turn-helix domain-containing protein [Bythopirellula goksoeyrii]|uniref:Helix-turn-helix domain protein n=1 Tax=Bythopirellula goksoeyrii TaxID=1400387 RepID=A0A5B9QI98_9BACT|nr:helix-turn-helix domain-containing protein [Bythopirellula goksoeyrii]QEG37699.1 Helix-turn-helix domain protein [Bythopirellula goksoeyrii]